MPDGHLAKRRQSVRFGEACRSRRVLMLRGAKLCGGTTLAWNLSSDTPFRALADTAVRELERRHGHWLTCDRSSTFAS